MQGERQTCAVFAVTAAHEWMSGDRPDLSEEDALWSAKQHDGTPGDATWPHCALLGISRNDHALSEDWPYGTPHYLQGRPDTAQDSERRRRCGSFRDDVDAAGTVEGISAVLSAGHAPILTMRFVQETWARAASDGWIDDPDPPTRGSHAVLAVGCVRQARNHSDAVIVKNSWSGQWGDGGYGYITDRYLAAHHVRTDVLQVSPR